MGEQLVLLTVPTMPAPRPRRPRCRRCPRPVMWHRDQGCWARHCGGAKCTGRKRFCDECGKLFDKSGDDAGTKYCSTKCRGRIRAPRRSDGDRPVCAWCNTAAVKGYRHPHPSWPYICATCTQPIERVVRQLRRHNVPHERARRLLTDPTCEVCGRDVLIAVRQISGGRTAAMLVVDHDHACCPRGPRSCGKCFRGLICRDCNLAAGMLRDDPVRTQALAEYLRAWQSRGAP